MSGAGSGLKAAVSQLHPGVASCLCRLSPWRQTAVKQRRFKSSVEGKSLDSGEISF